MHKFLSTVLAVTALAPAAAGCSPQAAPGAGAPQGTAPVAAASVPAPVDGQAKTITGTVAETMNASSYTYVRVKTSEGEVWAASSQFEVAVGDRVSVPLEVPMRDFHSETLNRDFPVIYFVSRIRREGETQAPPPLAVAHTSLGAGQQAGDSSMPAQPIAQPAGGTSVADVWANRKALAGKMVTVRGKVVKFNGGIMGRNWVHIQDGTGKAADGTHDLTFTSNDAAKVGDVVTATGTVAVDKDFTAGYKYAVIVEGVTLK